MQDIKYLMDSDVIEHEEDKRVLAIKAITLPFLDGRPAAERERSQELLLIPRTKEAAEHFFGLYEKIKDFVDLHSAEDFFQSE